MAVPLHGSAPRRIFLLQKGLKRGSARKAAASRSKFICKSPQAQVMCCKYLFFFKGNSQHSGVTACEKYFLYYLFCS
jgi:hypothetical protein